MKITRSNIKYNRKCYEDVIEKPSKRYSMNIKKEYKDK